eukprot:2953871-Prorocentrum_lima.AAC.1
MTFGAASTAQLNATWDVADLMAMVVEVCVQETGNLRSDWEIKVSIPTDSPSDVEQFRWRKEKWESIRPE